MNRRPLPLGVLTVIGMALLTLVLSYAALTRDYSTAAETAPPTPTAAPTEGATETAAPAEEVDPLDAPAGSRAVFFGDSWTAGYAAEPSEQGYAYLAGEALGWDSTVLGVPGTGYLNAGPAGEGTYLDRVDALPVDEAVDVVVIQGSVNDEWVDQRSLYAAIETTLTAVREKFPSADVVVLGPSPATQTATNRLWSVNNDLASAAQHLGLHFVSGMDWITPENWASVIDAEAANHPSTEGHAYLADRVVEAVGDLSAPQAQ